MDIVVPSQFNGPPYSGNGGWTSGHLAALLPDHDGAASVRLFSPPPLDTPMQVTTGHDSGELTALHGHVKVASARLAPPMETEDVPEPVQFAEAEAAGDSYAGLVDHPFPTCFSCGTERDPNEALCLRTGVVREGVYAAAWVPREVTPEIVWAAIDCPSGWALGVGGRPMVLGTMTAQVDELPEPGSELVVLAWPISSQGRKHHAGTALLQGDRMLAQARSVWISVDPESVRPIAG
ncbi:hypothetical protein IM660_17965 [Ruania alkalisoli]|uniref:Thioesterase family protein n=1 Tax=Ruania alkalisoli TaxID=2779775 RepID=A0A7M1SSC2_9MICO|nr:hypothetical protein [Ruania alkalisoli]QOR70450.1 hypothetical protein IM660_17965 [Ruania alkalisoli]